MEIGEARTAVSVIRKKQPVQHTKALPPDTDKTEIFFVMFIEALINDNRIINLVLKLFMIHISFHYGI